MNGDSAIRDIVQDAVASVHLRLEDQNRVSDLRHGEILKRFEQVNGRIGKAHDRAANLEGRVDGLEKSRRERHSLTDASLTVSDLRVWIFFGLACIGGTLAFLRFIGRL